MGWILTEILLPLLCLGSKDLCYHRTRPLFPTHSFSSNLTSFLKPTDPLTIRALAGSSVQRRVTMAVLVGRVSSETQQQAQGRGIVAGTGPVERRGLPSVHIKAGMSLEESLGSHQPSCRQVPPEASLSPVPAGSRGHGTLGLRKKWEMVAVRTQLRSSSSFSLYLPFPPPRISSKR